MPPTRGGVDGSPARSLTLARRQEVERDVCLQGRQILADQMDFLIAHFPRNSVLRKRVEKGQSLLVS